MKSAVPAALGVLLMAVAGIGVPILGGIGKSFVIWTNCRKQNLLRRFV